MIVKEEAAAAIDRLASLRCHDVCGIAVKGLYTLTRFLPASIEIR
jgi:hypothetical protein